MERYQTKQRRFTTRYGVLDRKTNEYVFGHDEKEVCDWKAGQLNDQHAANKAREKEAKRKESA